MPRFLPVLVPIVIFVGSSVLLAPRTASAQTTGTAALVIGSRAPNLPVAEWVKGTPVRIGDGKIHVVEFWATWCGPCKVSIPHLTQLSKKYAGKADFTGVSIWERGGDIPTRVKAFVKTMGPQMGYHVARDDASNTVAQSWMVAANQNGIPTAFIVDKTGTIVWIGHPMDGLDETLGQVIAGKYGVTTAKKAFQQKQAAAAVEDAKREQLNKLFGPALELANQRKFREAIGAIDKVIKTRPEYARDNNIVYLKFVLYMSYDQAAGQAFMAKAASRPGLDPRLLNKVAWGIVAPDSKIKTPDYASAVTIAKAAVLATRGQEPAVLDTLSYAYEKNGDIANAIATEEKAAVNVRNDSSQKGKEVRARLMQLKAKRKSGRR